MKKIILVLIIILFANIIFCEDVRLKPYILYGIGEGDLKSNVEKIETKLSENGFTILGKYSPMGDKNRVVICVTSEELKDACRKIGGLTMFASVLRFGINKDGEKVEISSMNPIYWGNAYYRKDFPKVEDKYDLLFKKIKTLLKETGNTHDLQYGSKKGLKIKKLRKYHYMIMMPYFDDVVKIAKKSDYEKVLEKIESNLSKKVNKIEKVYRLDFPDKKITLFGVALHGEKGEKKFIPKIDRTNPKHTTFMPYEFLVLENRVVMLHGKFRIALSFPDLGMGRFMKISGAPRQIAKYIKSLVK